MTFIFGLLASAAGALGPLALAGGPLGIAIAWLGSRFSSGTGKLVMIAIGLALVVGTTIGLTVHVQHLQRDRAAYRALSAQVAALQENYGCGARPAHERDLSACLAAIARDAETAKAAEIARQRDMAAAEQARQAADADSLRRAQESEAAAIDAGAQSHDGPVPGVLLDSWARERRARGVK